MALACRAVSASSFSRCTTSCLRPRGVVFIVLCAALLPNASALYDGALDFRTPGSLPNRRTDFCDRAEAVHNGSIGIEDCLRGLHLSLVTPLYNKPWFDEPINNTDPGKMTGFHVKLAAALAARAGFTYTIYSHQVSSFQPGMTWTEYLDVATQKFDIHADWWLGTDQRARMGIQAPHAFLDLSLVSATYAAEEEPNFWEIFWRFSDPLKPELWLTFIGISIATSLLYFLVEAKAEGSDFDPNTPMYFNVSRSMWIGLVQFTGAGGFSPRTCSGKLLVLTYSTFILLLVSGYTANLAAFLTVQRNAQACQSLDECVANGENVCVLQGTASDEWLSNEYPQLEKSGQIVRCEDSPWVCARSQACSLVVQPLTLYELALRNVEYNSGCDMSRVDVSSLRYFGGGWMSRVDYSTRCTSLLIDTLKAHLLAMQGDGELDDLVTDLYQSAMTGPSCSSDQDDMGDESSALPVTAMTGSLVLHGSVSVMTLLAFCARGLLARRRSGDKPPTGSMDEAAPAPAREADGEAPSERLSSEAALHAIQKDLQALQAKYANLSLGSGRQEPGCLTIEVDEAVSTPPLRSPRAQVLV